MRQCPECPWHYLNLYHQSVYKRDFDSLTITRENTLPAVKCKLYAMKWLPACAVLSYAHVLQLLRHYRSWSVWQLVWKTFNGSLVDSWVHALARTVDSWIQAAALCIDYHCVILLRSLQIFCGTRNFSFTFAKKPRKGHGFCLKTIKFIKINPTFIKPPFWIQQIQNI